MYNSYITYVIYIEEKMRNFNDYAERAIKRYGLAGNNALARELGVNKSSISQMSAGKIYPAEATMIKLAELAGMPKEEALIDLNLWRSKDKPELQKIWQNLAKILGCLILFLSIKVHTPLPSETTIISGNTTHNIYYVYYQKIKSLFFKYINFYKKYIFQIKQNIYCYTIFN